MSEIQALYPVVTALAAFAACTAVAIAVRSNREVRRLRRSFAAELQGIEEDTRALCAGAVGLGDCLNGVEHSLRRLQESHQRLALKDPGERPYAQAIRLVHNGADVEQLAESCGLTRSEAELILMLHGVDSAS